MGKAIPLFPPPALFAIQLNIESSVLQKQMDQLCQMEVFRHVIQFAEESSVVDSVIGSCQIKNTTPVGSFFSKPSSKCWVRLSTWPVQDFPGLKPACS